MSKTAQIAIMSVKLKGWFDTDSVVHGDKKGSLFREFTETATAHGIRNATDTKYGRFRRSFWILVVFGMLICLMYTVLSQVADMLSYPTISQHSIEFRNKLPFPAVTLCNLNQFRKSAFPDNNVTKLMLLAYSDPTNLNINWNDSMWNFAIPEDVTKDRPTFLGYPMSDTLIKCVWDMKLYNCSEIFVTQNTDFGVCYTFNGLTSGNFTPRETVHSGSKYGLTVIANVQQDEYLLGPSSDAAGLWVILHDPSETPLVEGRGFDVSPGTATKASIKMTQVTCLPPPYRGNDYTQCMNTSREDFSYFLHLFDRYDLSACYYECRYNYITGECGCRTIFDRGNATLCHPRDVLECYSPHFEKFTREEKYKECSCPRPCEIKLFDAEVSMSTYPSSALVEQTNRIFNKNIPESKLRQDYLKLTLTYDKLILEEIKQVPEFTFESIMSTLGGQLGIFIGASLISLLEFLEFGMEILILKVFKMDRKSKNTSSENIQ